MNNKDSDKKPDFSDLHHQANGDDISFSKHLSDLILRKRMSQNDLAKGAGTTQPVISAILNKHRPCGIRVAANLANALGLDGDERDYFMAKAKQPKWRVKNSPDVDYKATISRIMTKVLEANRIDPKDIKSIIPMPSAAGKGDAIIELVNGDVIEIKIEIKRYTTPIPEPADTDTTNGTTKPVMPTPPPGTKRPGNKTKLDYKKLLG